MEISFTTEKERCVEDIDCGEKYRNAKVANEIEQRIQTREKWDKNISVTVDVLPEGMAV